MSASAPATFHTKQGDIGLVIRAVSFFETDYFARGERRGEEAAAAAVRRRQGHVRRRLIATLRQDL